MATDHEIVKGGLDLNNPNVTHIHSLMRVLRERVAESQNARSTAPLMDFFYLNLSQTLAKIDSSRFACRKGCYYCCISWVAASAPELLYLLGHLPRDRSREIRDNLSAAFAITKDIAAEERLKMKTPCPMLRDNLCSIYEIRPLVCRTLVSYDATACERIYTAFTGERIPRSQAYDVLRNVYALALAGALRHAGLSPYFYEFNSALDRLMDLDKPEETWLLGEDILSDIPQDPGGNMFRDPWNEEVYGEAFK